MYGRGRAAEVFCEVTWHFVRPRFGSIFALCKNCEHRKLHCAMLLISMFAFQSTTPQERISVEQNITCYGSPAIQKRTRVFGFFGDEWSDWNLENNFLLQNWLKILHCLCQRPFLACNIWTHRGPALDSAPCPLEKNHREYGWVSLFD